MLACIGRRLRAGVFVEKSNFAESVCLTAEGWDNGDDGAIPLHVFGELRV
jgi:hypothetical protein